MSMATTGATGWATIHGLQHATHQGMRPQASPLSQRVHGLMACATVQSAGYVALLLWECSCFDGDIKVREWAGHQSTDTATMPNLAFRTLMRSATMPNK